MSFFSIRKEKKEEKMAKFKGKKSGQREKHEILFFKYYKVEILRVFFFTLIRGEDPP